MPLFNIPSPEETLQRWQNQLNVGQFREAREALKGPGLNYASQQFIQGLRQKQARSGLFTSQIGASTEATGFTAFQSYLQSILSQAQIQGMVSERLLPALAGEQRGEKFTPGPAVLSAAEYGRRQRVGGFSGILSGSVDDETAQVAPSFPTPTSSSPAPTSGSRRPRSRLLNQFRGRI